jgi:cytochrome bd-type quinol oxidase subunit 1
MHHLCVINVIYSEIIEHAPSSLTRRNNPEIFGLGWKELIIIGVILLMMLVALSIFYVILKREVEEGAEP